MSCVLQDESSVGVEEGTKGTREHGEAGPQVSRAQFTLRFGGLYQWPSRSTSTFNWTCVCARGI